MKDSGMRCSTAGMIGSIDNVSRPLFLDVKHYMEIPPFLGGRFLQVLCHKMSNRKIYFLLGVHAEMIKLDNVSMAYDNGVTALSNVSLNIAKGEFVFLVGTSGAGKTTLIKLIYREECPTTGQVLFDSKNTARLKGKEIPMLRRRIGMVFQDFRLLSQKTVNENVAFTLKIAGIRQKEIRKTVPSVLKRVGLEHKADMIPARLSGGEQQKVCIARAIVNRPPLIIADEPTGNLDPATSWEIMKLFIDINRRGTTVLVATHAWDIVNQMKRRIISLSGRGVIREGVREASAL